MGVGGDIQTNCFPLIFTSARKARSTTLHCILGNIVKLMLWELRPAELLCFEVCS